MQKNPFPIPIILMLINLVSCNLIDKDLRTNSILFMEAYMRFDITTAKEYVTENNKEFLDVYEKLITLQMIQAAKTTKVRLVTIEDKTDSTATAIFNIYNFISVNIFKGDGKFDIIEKDNYKLKMVKIKNKWLADMGK